MNKKLAGGLGVVLATAAITAGAPAPASADDTTVTFDLSGGFLSVSTQATAPLGDKGGSGTTSVSGSLGDTVVTDNRGGTAGWSIGASRGTFTDGTTTATAVTYRSGVPEFTGVVTATSTGTRTLTSTAVQVVSGTVVQGNNTATWDPTLTVTLPASSTAGSYSGTITTSLL